MKTFLNTVVDDLIRRYGRSGLGEVTMVFPMQRAGLFVRQYLLENMRASGDKTPIVLPQFTTIDALSDSLSELGSEDEIVSICRLYAAYCSHTKEHLPLDVFYGWGMQLMSDFSNSDMACTDVSKLMAYTADAAQLDMLELEDETRERLRHLLGERGDEHSVRRYYISLWESLPAVYEQFCASQQTDYVGTRGARMKWVTEHFDSERVQSRIAGRTFVFVGFNYLLNAERRLMELLREHARTLFYWDYDPAFHLDESLYKFLKDDISRLGSAMPDEAVATCSDIEAVACQSSSAEASYVHDWLIKNHHKGEKTAIVLADESMLQQVIYSLPQTADNSVFRRINVTKGYPLRLTHIFAELTDELEKPVYETLAPDEMLSRLASCLENRYRHEVKSEEDSWQQVLQDEAYYQTQVELRRLRALFDSNTLVQQEIESSRLLRNLIRRRLESVSIPFHGEPITDIQVIGVLETRLLDFDNVLILNVEEGVVPNTSVDRSFIPYDMRKAYGMQTRDEESKIYGYNFFRLLRRAKKVTMTFSEASTDMGQKTMSRFLMQMLSSRDYHLRRMRVAESSETAPLEIGETAIRPGEQFPAHLSPSSIGDYIECPREFYLKHIRRVSEPDEESVLFNQKIFGNMVHSTLENYYRSGMKLTLSEALDKAYETQNEEYNKHHPHSEPDPYQRNLHESENHVILTMAEAVRKKDLEQKSTVLLMEEKFTKILHPDGGDVELQSKVDRMDVLMENGREVLRIADYKTGKYDVAKLSFNTVDELFEDSKKRYALQTLIYCSVVRSSKKNPRPKLPLVPELIYPGNISANTHLWANGVELTSYEGELAETFEEKLLAMVSKIKNQTVFPAVEAKKCEDSHCYCPFHQLCGRKKKDF